MPAPAFGHFDGPKLARAREAAGLTRAQLAEKVGVGADVVGLWETRGVTPAAQHRPRVAEAVGLQVFDLYHPPEGTEGISGLRVRAGLSQRRLAQLVGVPQSTLSGWERGTVRLPDEKAQLLASALGVTADEVAQAASAAPSWTRERQHGPKEKTGAGANWASEKDVVPESPKTSWDSVHFVLAYVMEYVDDELVHASKEHQPVSVSSPQGGDPVGARSEGHMRLVDGTNKRMTLERPEQGVPEVFLHHEIRFSIDGEPVFALRRQVGPEDGKEDRETLLSSLGVLLVPQWSASPPVGGNDPAVKAAMRRELFDHFPASKEGVGRLFVLACPTDTYGWLRDQMEPGQGATAVIIEPGPPRKIRFLSCPASGALKTNDRRPDGDGAVWTTVEKLGLGPGDTLRDIFEALDSLS